MPPEQTVQDVVDRLRAISGELGPDDGVRHFNRVYLTVTERVAAALATGPGFADNAFMARLDVVFAQLWIDAYDAAVAGRGIPKAWAPLFEHRHKSGRYPIQFTLAGMNAHIEHDLPLAVVRTCVERGKQPDDRGVHEDYEAVNAVLASVERDIRRSFLDELQTVVDDRVGAVAHMISAWNIDKARDAAWVTTETLWALRRLKTLSARFTAALGHTVGMGSRCLLTPVPDLKRG